LLFSIAIPTGRVLLAGEVLSERAAVVFADALRTNTRITAVALDRMFQYPHRQLDWDYVSLLFGLYFCVAVLGRLTGHVRRQPFV
jgi:hypothetical protein